MLSCRQFIRNTAVTSIEKTLRLKAATSVQTMFTRGFSSVEKEEEDVQMENQPMGDAQLLALRDSRSELCQAIYSFTM